MCPRQAWNRGKGGKRGGKGEGRGRGRKRGGETQKMNNRKYIQHTISQLFDKSEVSSIRSGHGEPASSNSKLHSIYEYSM